MLTKKSVENAKDRRHYLRSRSKCEDNTKTIIKKYIIVIVSEITCLKVSTSGDLQRRERTFGYKSFFSS
jgi:uncharacterized protein YaaR (DUF327 family)